MPPHLYLTGIGDSGKQIAIDSTPKAPCDPTRNPSIQRVQLTRHTRRTQEKVATAVAGLSMNVHGPPRFQYV